MQEIETIITAKLDKAVDALRRILNRAMVHDQEVYEEIAKQTLTEIGG